MSDLISWYYEEKEINWWCSHGFALFCIGVALYKCTPAYLYALLFGSLICDKEHENIYS